MRYAIFSLIILSFVLTSCTPDVINSNQISEETTTENSQYAENPPSQTQTYNKKLEISNLPLITKDNISHLRKIDHFYGHTGGVDIVFHPDGKTLISYSVDGTFRLWDLHTGLEFMRFKQLGNIFGLDINPEGTIIASGGSDKTVRLWDFETGIELTVWEGYNTGIGWKSLAWSPDGSIIAAGSRGGVLRIWDVSTGEELFVLYDHFNDVTGIDFSSDGSLLATAGEDDSIIIWEVPSFNKKLIIEGHDNDVGDVAFSSDGSLLASISGDGTIKNKVVCLWEVASGDMIYCVDGHIKSWYGEISFSPDDSLIISCGGVENDGTIHIYDTETGDLLAVLEGEAEGIIGVSINHTGNLIASGSFDGVIELWAVELHD